MSSHAYVTVDVFAARPFEGNQLAVFPDASAIPGELLLPIAREFRFSETVFVLPAERGGAARVRIFTLDGEAPFAGHPLVGTAAVLAAGSDAEEMVLEVPAGPCRVLVRWEAGLRHATVTTPQPFALDGTVPAALLADALGVHVTDVLVDRHPPTACGMGRPFVVAELTADALAAARPDAAAFATARTQLGAERFAVLAYARLDSDTVEARMFSPLTGTVEDAATGSANVALAGLLLDRAEDRADLRLISHQGRAMGRPSLLELHAWRRDGRVWASVAGTVVPVTSGRLDLP